MKKNNLSMVSLLVFTTIVIITLISLLSLVSSLANYKLSSKQKNSNDAQIVCNNLAQKWLSELEDGHYENTFFSNDHYLTVDVEVINGKILINKWLYGSFWSQYNNINVWEGE